MANGCTHGHMGDMLVFIRDRMRDMPIPGQRGSANVHLLLRSLSLLPLLFTSWFAFLYLEDVASDLLLSLVLVLPLDV